MKRKLIWLVVSSLMVLALLAAACAPAEIEPTGGEPAGKTPVAKEETKPGEKEVAPTPGAGIIKVSLTKNDGTVVNKEVEKPKYGGTLIIQRYTTILAWDEAFQAPWTLATSLTQTNQDLVMGDWMRGISGTHEYSWQIHDWFGLASVTGELAESWEVLPPDTILYHVRPGVHWGLDSKSEASRLVGGRELTAEDVAWNIRRIYIDLKTSTMYGMLGAGRPTDAVAIDKYTVKVTVPAQYLGNAFQNMSDLTKMVPPEVVAKYGDMNKWENVVGTGPFFLTDYVPASSATWVRNLDYWEFDPVLGKDFPLPYLDGMRVLIIPDTSTRLAALRTGKTDFDQTNWNRENALPLLKENPDLQYSRVEPSGCTTLGWRIDKPELPFWDINVRRALLMAVDNQAITDSYFGGDAVILNYKVAPAQEYKDLSWYTPLEELPLETQELFTYHPDKAKQLLTDAGYPNGFKFAVITDSANAERMDIMEIVQEYWHQVGIEMKIDAKEQGVYYTIYQRKTHEEALICGRAGFIDSMYMCRKGNMYNWGMVDDPQMDDYYYPEVTAAFFDQPKKNALMKEMNLYALSKAYYYSPPRAYTYPIWQPWIKNFHGEAGPGVYSQGNAWRYTWVDEDLKKSMGY